MHQTLRIGLGIHNHSTVKGRRVVVAVLVKTPIAVYEHILRRRASRSIPYVPFVQVTMSCDQDL